MNKTKKHCISCKCIGGNASPSGLKPREFAKQYGLSDFAVYQGIRNGSIPSVRVGRRYIILTRRFEDMVLADETAL